MKLLVLAIALAMAVTLVPLAGAAIKPVVSLKITTVGNLSGDAVNFKFNVHNTLPVAAKAIVVRFWRNLHPYGQPRGGKLEGEPGSFFWKVPNLAPGLNRSIIIPLRSPTKPGLKLCASASIRFDGSRGSANTGPACFWWTSSR